MFERFTRSARAAVRGASTAALAEGSGRVEAGHLLRALVDGSPDVVRALRDLGADPAALRAASQDRAADVAARAGLDADDVAAIRALGIDVDAVLARAARVPAAPRRGVRRARRAAFAPTARACLVEALREARETRPAVLTDVHVLIGLVRADPGVRALLAEHGVTLSGLVAWHRHGGSPGDPGAVPAPV